MMVIDGGDNSVREKPASEDKKADEQEATARKRKTTKHSLVSTCQLMLSSANDYETPEDWVTERFAIPPRPMGDEKHAQLGRALIDSLETYVFGASFDDFLNGVLPFLHVLHFSFSCDGATNNACFFDKFEKWITFSATAERFSCTMTAYKAWCNLHKFGRTGVTLLKRLNVEKHLYAFSRLFRQSKPRRTLRKTLEQLVDIGGNFVYNCTILHIANLREHLDTLAELLTLTWGEDCKETVGSKVARLDAFRNMWRFLAEGGNIFNVRELGHLCSRRACGNSCGNENECRKKFKRFMYASFFASEIPQFQTGRWRKLIPSLKFRTEVFVFLAPVIAAGIAAVKVGDIHKDVRERLGKRLANALRWVQTPTAIFNLKTEGNATGKSDRGAKNQEEDQEPQRSHAFLIVREIRLLQNFLWVAFQDSEDGGSTPWDVVSEFFPDSHPDSERLRTIAWAVLLILSELHLRWEVEFCNYPYRLVPLEAAKSDNVWKVAAQNLLAMCLCCLPLMVRAWVKLINRILAHSPLAAGVADGPLAGAILKRLVAQWTCSLRGSSLTEE